MKKMKAPWPDYAGNDIYEGDTIRHPGVDGESAVVMLDEKRDEFGRWRAVYPDGMSLFLGNQVSKGMAVVVKPLARSAGIDTPAAAAEKNAAARRRMDAVAAQSAVAAASVARTKLRHDAINALLEVATAAYEAMDNSEERANASGGEDAEYLVQGSDFKALSSAMDKIDALPDDEPGIKSSGGRRAAWALRDLFAAPLHEAGNAAAVQDPKAAFEEWAEKDGTYDLRPYNWKVISVGGIPYDGYVRPYKQDRTVYAYQGFVAGLTAAAAPSIAAPTEVERDAKRYRFLREDPPLELAVRRYPSETERGCYLDGPTLDSAIDAAIATGEKP